MDIEADPPAKVRPELTWLGSADIDRAQALMDRRRGSPTYGCLDRPFWYYRTLTDFPGSTWQQAGWGLAELAARSTARNSDELAEAAIAAFAWWARIQKPDGSFDEWYRNERSYCPTAFTTAGAAETLHVLGDRVDPARGAAILHAVERAAGWLEGRWNPTVMNQNLAAALALLSLARLTGAARWHGAAERAYARLAEAQHEEGWFPEYEGMDFGYSTLALDLLAVAHRRGAGEMVTPMAGRLADFLWRAKGAGPGYPGRLGSRGTGHLFPFGAFYFAGILPQTGALARQWTTDHRTGLVPRPAMADDRYFSYFYFPAFALAQGAPQLPGLAAGSEPGGARRDEILGAGLTIHRRAKASIALSARLGGALAVERPGRAPLYLLGYELVEEGRRQWSTARAWDAGQAPSRGAGPQSVIAIGSEAARVRDEQPLVRWALPFHLLTRALSIGPLAKAFQSAVKRRMITRQVTGGIRLHRTVSFHESFVEVRDRISIRDGASGRLRATADIAIHSPSAMIDRADGGLAAAVNAQLADRRAQRETEIVLAIPYDETAAPAVKVEEPSDTPRSASGPAI